MSVPLSITRDYNFSAGINERISPLSMDRVELSTAQNVDFFVQNAVRKRSGYVRRIDAGVNGTNAITGLYEYRLKDGTEHFLATTGSTIERDASGTWTDITGGVTITSGQDNKFSFDTYDDIMIATNGVDAVIAWTGSGNVAALSGSPPIAKWVTHYNEHEFLARNNTNRSRLFISNQGDPETWGAADFIDIGKDDGQEITGLAVLYDRLFIFKRKSIYQLSGTGVGNFRVDLVSQDVGAVSGWSIANVENTLIFLSERGFYEFTGSTPTLISDKIHTTLLGLNQNRTEFAHGIHYKRRFQYWCSVTNGAGTTHDRILVWDYLNKGWSVFVGINANAFGLEQSGASMDLLFHGDYSSVVHLQDSGNVDDDTDQNAINATFRCHPVDVGAPELFKRFRYVRPFFDQEGSFNVTVTYETDFGTTGSSTEVSLSLSGNQSLWGVLTWGTDNWGGATILQPFIRLAGASGRHLELTFSNNSINQPFVMHGFSVMARRLGVKRSVAV